MSRKQSRRPATARFVGYVGLPCANAGHLNCGIGIPVCIVLTPNASTRPPEVLNLLLSARF